MHDMCMLWKIFLLKDVHSWWQCHSGIASETDMLLLQHHFSLASFQPPDPFRLVVTLCFLTCSSKDKVSFVMGFKFNFIILCHLCIAKNNIIVLHINFNAHRPLIVKLCKICVLVTSMLLNETFKQ